MLPLSPESPNFSYQNSELGIRNNLTGGCLFLKSSRPSHRFQLPWLLRSTVLQSCSPEVEGAFGTSAFAGSFYTKNNIKWPSCEIQPAMLDMWRN